jgi:glycosyltransferase involved in cell wall biosynthesis
VATAVGGVPDLIDSGVHGLLVDPADITGVVEAVSLLLERPDLRRKMGEAARERQRREFDIDTMVRRLEDLYERLFLETARGRQEARVGGPP